MAENNETFKDILDSITSKLTGEREKDFKYLQNMCEQYKDHRYAKEIIRALGRIMFDLLPEEEKEKMAQLLILSNYLDFTMRCTLILMTGLN